MAKQGGDSGPALVPGSKSKSLLLERIHLPEDDDEIMPPKGGPLSSEAKEILNRWVESGANWPDGVQLHEISKEELSLRKNLQTKHWSRWQHILLKFPSKAKKTLTP